MAKNNALETLKRAQQALMIAKDDSNLQDYVAAKKDKKTEKSRLIMTGIEVKYIPQYDGRKFPYNTKTGEAQSGSGFRTRFMLADGTTVGTFSQAAYELYKVYAVLTGNEIEPDFCHIDIVGEDGKPGGTVAVDVQVVKIEGTKKSTYAFEIVDEGSNVGGASAYLPQSSGFLALGAGDQHETEFDPDQA